MINGSRNQEITVDAALVRHHWSMTEVMTPADRAFMDFLHDSWIEAEERDAMHDVEVEQVRNHCIHLLQQDYVARGLAPPTHHDAACQLAAVKRIMRARLGIDDSDTSAHGFRERARIELQGPPLITQITIRNEDGAPHHAWNSFSSSHVLPTSDRDFHGPSVADPGAAMDQALQFDATVAGFAAGTSGGTDTKHESNDEI